MKRTGCVLLVVALSSAVGCAAMTYGSSQEVKFFSSPPGASLEIDGKHVAATPTTVKLKRRKDHSAVLRMEGYEDGVVTVDSRISGEAVALSIAAAIWWWGPFEWILDVPLGSLKELTPPRVSVSLEKTEEQKRLDALVERRRQEALRAKAFAEDPDRICRERGWSSISCQLEQAKRTRGQSPPTYYYPARQE
jgi:hypothetical protein